MVKSSSENSHLTDEDRKYFEKIGVNTNSGHFKRFHSAGLLNIKDEAFAFEVQEYWKKHYNKQIDPVLHLAFMNLHGKKEPRLIPSSEMWNEILPFFNDMNIRVGYSDKNIYDKLINPPRSAETVLKRVRGHYFDPDNNYVDIKEAKKIMLSCFEDLIIKPSDNDNGVGIERLEYRAGSLYLDEKEVTIHDLEELYGFNFIVQKVIQQHSVMATPHPASVNTLRMVTLRWKNEIRHLLTYARFGAKLNVKDHARSGGVSVGVKDSGELVNFAIDTNCFVHSHHPTTNYSFSNYAQIPNYDDFKQYVTDLHKKILHHDYVSWDIAVGSDGQPVFIEANFRGTSWRYQLASQKPLFGELTEEVLEYVSDALSKHKFNRNVKSNLPKLRNRNRELRGQNKKLRTRNKELKLQLRQSKRKKQKLRTLLKDRENELKNIKKKYKKLQESRSWRYTLPLRKLGRTYRNFFND